MLNSIWLKNLFDFGTALFVLICLTPLLLIIALLVRVKIGSPILFRQQRPGLNAKPFVMCKFRTMTDERDSKMNLLPDEKRLTGLGRFLRSSSLDELPELLNIIKCEMSLVGPRPLLMEYLPLYSAEQASRHLVRPGITGWAQVNGRNGIPWAEKLKLDVWYVKNRTFWLDLKILFITFSKVLTQQGIHQAGHVTIEKFTGNKNES